ncbi:MAG: hypothetical protein KAY32_02580 [Candidatus Eisenbacteria sp.]|nr:hypothetical protein [Candidatus Eisenbacteria bacterium]
MVIGSWKTHCSRRAPAPAGRLDLGWAIALTALAVSLAFSACSRGSAEAPPEVLSLRHQIFSTERYRELADQWETHARAHSQDPFVFVEWGDALRYAGETGAANEKYRHAFALDSTDARAINAYVQMQCMEHADGADWELSHGRLLRAAATAPENPEIYYNLWMTSMRTGRFEQAASSLERMVALGDISKPLYDYAYNMLAGAPPAAIIFTNGDNDTYPPLAIQVLEGVRPDVAIVNLSLLNTKWYIRYLRGKGLPITLGDAEIDALKATKDDLVSAQMQRHLYAQLEEASWPRSICYAVTVYGSCKILPGRRLLEGLLERILPGTEAAVVDAELDVARTRELLDSVYRLDSITDPQIDWEREMAVAKLGTNYGVLLAKVGEALSMEEPPRDGAAYFQRAAQFLIFHEEREWLARILARWEELDPENPQLRQLRAQPENP